MARNSLSFGSETTQLRKCHIFKSLSHATKIFEAPGLTVF
jgi:hypothetical protein